MKATVQRIKQIRGFLPTTYAVWQGKDCVKIFLDKKEADRLANELNEKEDVH